MEKLFGPYELENLVGFGGMGEVFLAKDTRSGRQVALKKIKPDLQEKESIQKRFMREAKIASRLSHPNIIPIYEIGHLYYTMPYIQGKTLKDLLKTGKESIPHLTRIFLSVCQAISYAHSQNILHRDIKTENIFLGKFDELYIFDWGLADYVNRDEELLTENPIEHDVTLPGKIPGTLSHIAPERSLGKPSTFQTDIYALGVILFQILTLHIPFKRRSLKELKKTYQHEIMPDPREIAPYRDIPEELIRIADRCLKTDPQERYPTVDALISDLINFLEAKSAPQIVEKLNIDDPKQWQFQEHIPLTHQIALATEPFISDWAYLMISKRSFPGNIKMVIDFTAGENLQEIGFFLSIPEKQYREKLLQGVLILLGSEAKIFVDGVERLKNQASKLPIQSHAQIAIEKEQHHIRVWLNDTLILDFLSHLPLLGTHVGMLVKKGPFSINTWHIFQSSTLTQVSCLAIPDALLAYKQYELALVEYRRIATSLPGRKEAREALFSAGITMIEMAKAARTKEQKSRLLLLALDEFNKLRASSGPLEYLGKSLVYKMNAELEEEIKCLELAIRKYAKHPLLSLVKENLFFRLHEAAAYSRTAAYQFLLLALKFYPEVFFEQEHHALLENLQKNWHIPPFLQGTDTKLILSFFLAKPISIIELIESGIAPRIAFYALLHLGCEFWVRENLNLLEESLRQEFCPTQDSIPSQDMLDYLMNESIDNRDEEAIEKLKAFPLAPLTLTKAHMFLREKSKALALLPQLPHKIAQDIYSLLTSTKISNSSRYPNPTALAPAYLHDLLPPAWQQTSLAYERLELYRYLLLHARLLGQAKQEKLYQKKIRYEKTLIRKILQ